MAILTLQLDCTMHRTGGSGSDGESIIRTQKQCFVAFTQQFIYGDTYGGGTGHGLTSWLGVFGNGTGVGFFL